MSAGNPFRLWPADSFVDLICRLAAADPGRRIILTSGPSDAAAATQVAERARARLTSTQREAVLQAANRAYPPSAPLPAYRQALAIKLADDLRD